MGSGASGRVAVVVLVVLLHPSSSLPLPSFLGIAPHDRKYFESEVITCRDGSKSFPRQRLNDGFCDCPDGTDEPGTSACPEGRFYCRNSGDVSRSLFSSRVNDRICDCCDGSDEYDGGVDCPNSCRKDGAVADDIMERGSETVFKIHDHRVERIRSIHLEDLVMNIKELRIAAFVELLVAATMISCCLFRWCARSKRRRYSFRNL